jgi:sugar phosphate isomerase/epimerase
VTGAGEHAATDTREKKVEAEAKRIAEIATAAQSIGSVVGLYNHGGWFGEPENQIAIIERLNRDGIHNVGIVYNLHHGHDQLDRFEVLLKLMKPHLIALNLNGMTAGGDRKGMKILPLAQGNLDLELLQLIEASGWMGPVGILNHTDEDAEKRLRDNLEGLAWLTRQLEGLPAGERPTPVSWRKPQATVR